MDEPLRVLHLASHDGNWEPFSRIAGLAAALRAQGLTSIIATHDHSRLWEFAEAAGVDTAEYLVERSLNPLRWREFGNFVKAQGATVVHAHDAPSATLLARSRMFLPTIRVVTSRYDLDTPIEANEHAASVHAVVCPSEALAAKFRERDGGDRVSVVYDGVNQPAADRAGEERDTIRASYRDSVCPDKEKPLFIVAISPLEANSGLDKLIEIMPDIMAVRPQTHFFIMGEGGMRPDLERQIRITALERDVTILEPDKAFIRLLAGADLFVSNEQNDVSGMMVQAAMASGRAVVLPAAGCYEELVEDDKTGVIVRDANFKDAILDLLQNRTRREHLGRLAKARAHKLFNMETIAARMTAIYTGA
ncbi:MAG: glycosyltransferase family 4 protein [Planctomycetes bacterium]|nr:glycosyltransferase family 4 protein [Planctomycetota bacterium]